jgi:hypothetical protein
MGRHARVLLVVLLVLMDRPDDAVARSRHHGRLVTPKVPAPSPLARPPLARPSTGSSTASRSFTPRVDHAVGCSCTSISSCPEIGRLAIDGYRSQALYCNQLNGVENVGVRNDRYWYYQCAELANRWLVESVGAPRITGNADQMCDNADRGSFDVHTKKTTYEPVPGDLLVWGGYAMGHVGVVTSVSTSSIVVANQNYGHGGLQYPLLAAPRTDGFFGSPRGDRGLHAKCIIHPRKLSPSRGPVLATPTPSGPCAHVTSANDGAYCGASRQSGFAGGDEGTLYACRGGRTTAVRCRSKCGLEPVGRADHCL